MRWAYAFCFGKARPFFMMILNPKVPVALLALAVGYSAAAYAGTSGQATALLARSLAALSSGQTIRDVKLQGAVNYVAGSDEETGPATLEAAGDVQNRVVLNLSGGQRTQIQNGVLASSTGPDGQTQLLPLHNSLNPAAWFFPALLVQGLLQDPSYSVTYDGIEDLNGASAHHFSAVRAPSGQGDAQTMALLGQLSAFDLYLGTGTLLPVSLAFNTHPGNNALQDIPISIEFSGYGKTSGVMTPLHIQKYLQRSLLLDISAPSVSINSGLAPGDFQIQ